MGRAEETARGLDRRPSSWLAALYPAAFRAAERSPLMPALGHARMFSTRRNAVRACESQEEGARHG